MLAQSPHETVKEAPQEVPRTVTANGTSQKQQTSAKQPSAVAIKGGTTAISQNVADKSANQEDEKRSQGIILWSAIAQGGSAIVIAILTVVLLWYSHRGWKVAQQSADAATRSAKMAERALNVLECADVLVVKIAQPTRYPVPDGVTDVITCAVTVKNHGRTRAENLMMVGRISLSGPEEAPVIVKAISVPMILGAGDSFELLFPPITGDVAKEIFAVPLRSLLITVFMTYHDIFGQNYNIRASGGYWPAVNKQFFVIHEPWENN